MNQYCKTIEGNINILFSLLSKALDQEYIGEPVSQLAHALQAAEYAKILYPNDDEFILAALLHDIGHICVEENQNNYMIMKNSDNRNNNNGNNDNNNNNNDNNADNISVEYLKMKQFNMRHLFF